MGSKHFATQVAVGALIEGIGVEKFKPLLSSLDPRIRASLAHTRGLPVELLEELSRDESEMVRGLAASNPGLTEEIAMRLGCDDGVQVRMFLAECMPFSSEPVLWMLETDEHRFVRQVVALRKDLTVAMVDRLIDDVDDNVAKRALHNSNASERALVKALRTQERPPLVWAALSNANLPWNYASEYLTGADASFAARALANPNIPTNLLLEYYQRFTDSATDETREDFDSLTRRSLVDLIRMQVAINPITPPELLDELAKTNGRPDILFEIARNPNVSVETSDWLIANTTGEVKGAAIENANPSPVALMNVILDDPQNYFQEVILAPTAYERLVSMSHDLLEDLHYGPARAANEDDDSEVSNTDV